MLEKDLVVPDELLHQLGLVTEVLERVHFVLGANHARRKHDGKVGDSHLVGGFILGDLPMSVC